MIEPVDAEQVSAAMAIQATRIELEAATKMFEAAVWRGSASRLNETTEAAHSALDAHLEAIAGNLAVAKRNAGL